MKIVLQEVLNAKIFIDGQEHSSIEKGFLLLVSFKEGDKEETISKMALKTSKLRVFLDENGKTNLSLNDVKGDILSVSQFTLYADIKKSNRPSYINCMKGELASKYYDKFNDELVKLGFNVKTGVFGADMKVSFINDGPYTLVIDSDELGY